MGISRGKAGLECSGQQKAGLAAVCSARDAAVNCINELQTEVTVELGKESSFLKEM